MLQVLALVVEQQQQLVACLVDSSNNRPLGCLVAHNSKPKVGRCMYLICCCLSYVNTNEHVLYYIESYLFTEIFVDNYHSVICWHRLACVCMAVWQGQTCLE